MFSDPTASFLRLGLCLCQKWHPVPGGMGVGNAGHSTRPATCYPGFGGSRCWDYN